MEIIRLLKSVSRTSSLTFIRGYLSKNPYSNGIGSFGNRSHHFVLISLIFIEVISLIRLNVPPDEPEEKDFNILTRS